MNEPEPELSRDLLHGASEIALFVFGNRNMRRRVYHLAATSNMHGLFFKMGGMLCARKSAILRFIKG